MSLLEISGLDVHYRRRTGRLHALRSVSFTIGAGETVGVIGETGSGKSTLARTILGLVRPSAGRILLDGSDVAAFSPRQWRELRRRGVVQYVFQDPLRSLDPDLTIGDSLAEPLHIRGGVPDAGERVRTILARVRLDAELLDRLPGELSGGQRQRVAVARALITEPRLVLLDEPVSALDSANRVRVLELLKELRDAGTALMFISHDLGSVAGITDRVAVLYQGEIVEDRATRDVINSPEHPYTRKLIRSVPTLRREDRRTPEGIPA
ncbi:hypothetical protein GCM10010112_85200 [Actinoplanes lobatus]|uniref:ABC-type glutathione transport system ATPase component n=1 Tax=Actinoplanes lobatus TaxID=113568 RepID=A0A7W7HGY8_9ACTN|nr:ABC transporter ATP-binding protein [Actinoplanes lobatus]MBB4749917.1 ABC-type glutathione transport system ATPase component [Actinoplanes lobatus]GGN95179.1 hypothetical protein GCM10010112_85200 [Actinoplanes lobatus]GIE45008.1 hypothetical protein Alo02nite_79060 [Actinoplanes lobatus]